MFPQARARELRSPKTSRAAVAALVSFVYIQCRPHRPEPVVRAQKEVSSFLDGLLPKEEAPEAFQGLS